MGPRITRWNCRKSTKRRKRFHLTGLDYPQVLSLFYFTLPFAPKTPSRRVTKNSWEPALPPSVVGILPM